MSTRPIASNTVWLLAERLFRGVVAITVTAAVARYLGPSQFGTLSYAISFVLLFATLWTLGLSGLVIRELVGEPEAHDEILGTLFALRVIGALLGIAAILGSAFLFGVDDPLARAAIAILSISTLFYAFDGIDFWLQSEVRSRYEVIARSGALLLTSALNLVLIAAGAPLLLFAVAAGLEFVAAAAGLVIAYRLLGFSILKWRISWNRAGSFLVMSWPLILSGAFNAVNLKIDQLMLGNMAGTAAVGTYAAAARLSEVWYFVPTAVAASVFPSLLIAKRDSTSAYEHQQQVLYDLMIWLSLPIAIGMTVLSGPIVALLYGPSYADSSAILAIHIWAGPFVFMAAILSKWLIAENLLKFSFIRHGIGAIINVGLNLLLIPPLGGMGAAVATLVSYAAASYVACFAYRPTWPAARRMSMALIAPLRAVARLNPS